MPTLLFIALLAALSVALRRAIRFLSGAQVYRVLYVVDGDTVQVEPTHGGKEKRVRLLGIDAPESYDSEKLRRELADTGESRAAHMARGEEAKRHLKGLVDGRRVQLECGSRKKGFHGRTLARVWVLDGRGRRAFEAGAQMLSDGHAIRN